MRAHPIPLPDEGTDKNMRGRVMVLGGCLEVPGGIRLTGEAALRAGAGKVRIGTIAPAAIMIGTLLPEAAVVALPVSDNGEIDASVTVLERHVRRCDAIVVGPAMACRDHAFGLLEAVLDLVGEEQDIVIDAAALMKLGGHAERLRRRQRPAILTPHPGEIAAMLGEDPTVLEQDRANTARRAAARFNAVVVLKGSTTLVAGPEGALFFYGGGTTGLATSGSGDVLAGIAAALLARGCNPLAGALWAVWLHGEAGRRCADTIGPLGFRASDLLALLPRLMQSGGQS
ncbi:NAD(P)H-hydrate dehydratase [Novosphingobium gossypii]|uniref:NAD(P)H-hydrate dehydratase n=1 Tax=Novosphingobium gossypii TaxID=1604774 RepID=UPI003D238352